MVFFSSISKPEALAVSTHIPADCILLLNVYTKIHVYRNKKKTCFLLKDLFTLQGFIQKNMGNLYVPVSQEHLGWESKGTGAFYNANLCFKIHVLVEHCLNYWMYFIVQSVAWDMHVCNCYCRTTCSRL